MDIKINLLDKAGVSHSFPGKISFLKFMKHACLAGLGRNFAIVPAMFNWIGIGFFYGSKFSFRSNHIQRIWPIYDPDDIGAMSRIVGRSVADIYAKSHFGASHTICYEHSMLEMGIEIQGGRPDFICIDKQNQAMFSLEAKGYSQKTLSNAQFATHKVQAGIGPIPVAFGVASVTYNIYNEVRARIEDPPVNEGDYDDALADRLIVAYLNAVRRRLGSFCETTSPPDRMRDSHVAYDASAFILPPAERRHRFIVIAPAPGVSASRQFEPIDVDGMYMDKDGIGILFD